MRTKALFWLLLIVGVTRGGTAIAAVDVGWMQPGVRLWYLGAVDSGGVTSSNAEESCLIDAVVGTDARLVRHSALNHWKSPRPVETETYSLVGMGPCWIHPQRLQGLKAGEYWMGQEITLVVPSTYTYATFPYRLLPIKALFDIKPQRQIVKLSYMMPGFSVGNAYFDLDTGILLYHHALWGANRMFFILGEINYDFAHRTAFAEDGGPHTGFKSFLSEQSLGSSWGVGGGSVIIQSLVETRYGAAVEMRVLSAIAAPGYPAGTGELEQADESYCFFGDVPILRRMDATQAPNFPPEQWNPFGQYLWWWLPPTATGAGAAVTASSGSATAVQTIDVFDVVMAKTADQPLTFAATSTPQRFHFTTLWFDSHGYMTSFAARDPTSGLDLRPGDMYFQNLTTIDGLDYYRNVIVHPPRVSPSAGSIAGGTSVTVSGSGFTAQAAVTFGGVQATEIVIVSPTQFTAKAPAHAPGPVDVVITSSLGSATLAAGFRYVNAATGLGLAFDDDLVTDVSVYRPSTGRWFILPSVTDFDPNHTQAYAFGKSGDVPVMGDFDGDGKRDVAVYRPSTGTWFWLKSTTNSAQYAFKGWGMQSYGDIPAPGDYDGDAKTDLTVYRPAYGTWFILKSSSNYTRYLAIGWGEGIDQVVPADYDGDGKTDVAVYRPSTGQWFVLPSSTNFSRGWAPVVFGDARLGDVPVRGDFDGDGKADIAIYRPTSGTWFWLKSSTNNKQYDYRGWGEHAQGDIPVPGDYDGDRKTDPCVYRSQYGTWFVLLSSANSKQYASYGWGAAGDVPLGGQR